MYRLEMGEKQRGKFMFEGFTFDPSSGELISKNYRQRLPEQNARLLAILIGKPGIVLERAELRAEMWPSGEHLNHDHAISNGINQLRYVLRDNPRSPSYIETLPKRGYRFIAQVQFQVEPASHEAESLPDASGAALQVPDKIALPPQGDASVAEIEQNVQHRFARRNVLAWPIVILAVALACCLGLFVKARRNAATPSGTGGQEIRLAIAPIQAKGTIAEQLAGPFRLDLTDTASQLPGVQVIAANSFTTEQTDQGHLAEQAMKLQADVLLVGSMTSTSDTLQLSFELIRGRDAVHLTSLQYTGNPQELGRIRSDMERDLFRALSDTRHNLLNPLHSTSNTQAYSEYLQARYKLLEHNDESIASSIVLFKKALDEDAGFAQAYSGLGSASLLLAEHASVGKDAKYEAARLASQKAIALNPRVAEAHATLGFVLFRHDWNAAAAEPEMKRAVELEPGQAMHRIMYALLLGNTGHLPEALVQVDQAHASDPLWPPVYLTEMYLAAAAKDNGRALTAAHTLLKLKPDWTLAHDQSAWALWYAGRHTEAVEEWLRMAELEHDSARADLERRGLAVLRTEGVEAYARIKITAATNAAFLTHANDFQLAEWQLCAGEHTKAIRSLQAMVDARDPDSLQIAVSPAYFSLHADPAFQDVVRRIGPLRTEGSAR